MEPAPQPRPGPPLDPSMGVVLRDPLPWDQLRLVAEAAEETGYDAVFVPEISGREAFATLAGLAGATDRVRLGTGVVTIWARNPITTAMAAATIQDLSRGRMILGVGAGTPPGPAAANLVEAAGSLGLVRDYVRHVRAVLAEEPVPSNGPFEVGEFQLALSQQSAGGPPPVWLGALGDRMLRLAGEIADGVVMNWCTPDRVREARGIIREGTRAAGREPRSVTIAVYVRACLGVEVSAAMAGLQEMTGQYASIPQYRRQMEQMALGPEASVAAEAFARGRPQDVPEDLVRSLAVVGGRTEALARFETYREAGADLVLCYPVAALDPLSSIMGTMMAAAPSPAVER